MATITELWLRYTALLKEKLPPLYAGLNPPASQEELDRVEKDYKISENPFFSELVEILKINNGGTVGLDLLPIEYAFPDPLGHSAWLREDFEDEPSTIYYSIPKEYVKTTYLCKNWIEFASDGIGGGLYIDLEPSEKGKKGQIISSNGDECQKVVFADSLSDFLLALIKKLETGDYCLETTEGKENQAGQFFYNFRFTKIDYEGSLAVSAMNMLGIVDEENDLLGVRKR